MSVIELRNIISVSGPMRSVCSVIPMKSFGGMLPYTGCSQRTSASTLSIVPSVEPHERLVVGEDLRRADRDLEIGEQAHPADVVSGRRPTSRTRRPVWKCLARYIARSAAASSAAVVWPCSGAIAAPMLTVDVTGKPDRSCGSLSTASHPATSSRVSSAPCDAEGRSTANSSPPRRERRRRRGQDPLQPLGEAAQQAVADRVAEPVVDVLEPVEVHHQHERRGGPSRSRRAASTQPFVERATVQQHRERVVVGLVLAAEHAAGRLVHEERR